MRPSQARLGSENDSGWAAAVGSSDLGGVVMGKNLCPAISLRLAVGGVSTHDPLLRVESRIRERPKRSAPGRRLDREMVTCRKRVSNRVSSQTPKKEPAVIRGAA